MPAEFPHDDFLDAVLQKYPTDGELRFTLPGVLKLRLIS
jgi:hypothetical protein